MGCSSPVNNLYMANVFMLRHVSINHQLYLKINRNRSGLDTVVNIFYLLSAQCQSSLRWFIFDIFNICNIGAGP